MKLVSILIAAAALGASAEAQTPRYVLTDLGALGPNGQPFAITNNGVIGGTSVLSTAAEHAVLFYKGQKGDLATPGLGGQNSVVYGVNERGQAVGQAETSTHDPNGEDFCGFKALGQPAAGTTCLAFLWQYAVMVPLPTLGGSNGTALQVNRGGTVAGYAENATVDPNCVAPQKLQFKPLIWQNGEAQELPTSSGDVEGAAYGINDSGQVVGASGSCAALSEFTGLYMQPLHALLWETGTVTDLGSLGGTGQGSGIFAHAINNQGQAVGYSDLRGNANFHAFLWARATGMQDLGTLSGDVNSLANALNDEGDVVGVSLDANFNPRAFLWENGTMTDLNTLIPANSPLSLLLACGINSSGQIVGFAVTGTGVAHGFLLTPTSLATSNGSAPSGTNAVVTPLNLTTAAPSVVLDGSGSSSASGPLRYLYQVVPGGQQAAILQTPNDPKATVEFVNGAGLYLFELTVTDSAGTSAKSPVVMLNYQPSTTSDLFMAGPSHSPSNP
jgi:probable HAF family extracellular repeat protein